MTIASLRNYTNVAPVFYTTFSPTEPKEKQTETFLPYQGLNLTVASSKTRRQEDLPERLGIWKRKNSWKSYGMLPRVSPSSPLFNSLDPTSLTFARPRSSITWLCPSLEHRTTQKNTASISPTKMLDVIC